MKPDGSAIVSGGSASTPSVGKKGTTPIPALGSFPAKPELPDLPGLPTVKGPTPPPAPLSTSKQPIDRLHLLHDAALSPQTCQPESIFFAPMPPPDTTPSATPPRKRVATARSAGSIAAIADGEDSPSPSPGRGRGRGGRGGRGRGRGRKPAASKLGAQKRPASDNSPTVAPGATRPVLGVPGNPVSHSTMPMLPPGVSYSVTDSRDGTMRVMSDGSGGGLWGSGIAGGHRGPPPVGLQRQKNPLENVPEELRTAVAQHLIHLGQRGNAPWLNNPLAVSLYISNIVQQLQDQRQQQANMHSDIPNKGASWHSPWQKQQAQKAGVSGSQAMVDHYGTGNVVGPMKAHASVTKRGDSRPPFSSRLSHLMIPDQAQNPVHIISPNKREALLYMPDLEGPSNRKQYSIRAQQVEDILKSQEAELGDSHPHIGKTCTVLCKLYMKVGGEEGLRKADLMNKRAWNICKTCQSAIGRDNTSVDSSFRYLHEYIQSLENAAKA